MIARATHLACLSALLLLCACSTQEKMAKEPPPLVDMEEPLPLAEEPKDEPARQALPKGAFTGIRVDESQTTLDNGGPGGVRVATVVENSPAEAGGIEVGDLLLEASAPGIEPHTFRFASEWRKFELELKGGETIHLVVDHAGVEREVDVLTVARFKAAERGEVERYREEDRLGVVLRTATEVEARAAGLGPGAGAVIVGLSARSPLRGSGLRFEDVLVAVDHRPISHPQVFLEAVREAPAGGELLVRYARAGAIAEANVPVSEREDAFESVYVPLLFSYKEKGEESDFSFLLGLFGYESTAAAWKFKLFWLLNFGGGETDKLEEVKP